MARRYNRAQIMRARHKVAMAKHRLIKAAYESQVAQQELVEAKPIADPISEKEEDEYVPFQEKFDKFLETLERMRSKDWANYDFKVPSIDVNKMFVSSGEYELTGGVGDDDLVATDDADSSHSAEGSSDMLIQYGSSILIDNSKTEEGVYGCQVIWDDIGPLRREMIIQNISRPQNAWQRSDIQFGGVGFEYSGPRGNPIITIPIAAIEFGSPYIPEIGLYLDFGIKTPKIQIPFFGSLKGGFEMGGGVYIDMVNNKVAVGGHLGVKATYKDKVSKSLSLLRGIELKTGESVSCHKK